VRFVPRLSDVVNDTLAVCSECGALPGQHHPVWCVDTIGAPLSGDETSVYADGALSVENPKEAAGRAKLPLHLCPPAAKREMTLALEIGANKYGPWNWRGAGINLMTYIGAMQRHLDAIHAGEDTDPDSGVSHIGHILAGAAIVADAEEHGMLTDDRPQRGGRE
jgi:hypothetical protein